MSKRNENRPGFKKAKIGWIPEDWDLNNLEECADVRFSNVDKKSNEKEIAVKLCNYTDVYYNETITNRIDFMLASATKFEIEKFCLQKGDVIITKDSETPDDIAVPSFVSEDLDKVICGYHLALIRPNRNKLLGEFLAKLLQLHVYRYYFFTLANGVTRFGLSSNATYKALIPRPSILEQKKIAEILLTWERMVEQTQKLIKVKKKLKKGLMQQLITGQFRFPEYGKCMTKKIFQLTKEKDNPKAVEQLEEAGYKKTTIGWIPEDWEVIKFKDTCELVRGPFGGALKKEIFVSEGYKVYEQQHAIYDNFENGDYYIDSVKYSEMIRFSLRPGDIIMSCSGTAGKFAIFPNYAKHGVINQALLKIRPKPNLIETDYLFYYLNSRSFQKKLFADFAGGAIKNIAGMPVIKSIPILFPSYKEQKKIANALSDCDKEIEFLKKKEEALQKQKKGLMQKLLTGEVRVSVGK